MTTGGRHVFPFCPHCRTEMIHREEGGVQRPACSACGFVQYLNPAPGAGVILIRDGRICLVQRKFPPKVDQWTLPTGFMEWDETIEQTAVREVLEETGLEVKLSRLYSVDTGIVPPDLPVLVVFFQGEETGGSLQAGDDAAAVDFYPFDKFPGPIAFGSHRRVIARIRDELAGES